MTSAVERLQQALHTIDQAGAQGRAIFTQLYPQAALEAAQAADARAARGLSLGPLDGALVSIKDLLDVAGQTTTAGAQLLQAQPPATHDAAVVQRVRAAGAVIIGKTNMTEFAFSGIGINPHFGTPGNAHDAQRIPGGSSSGAGVSVALGMVDMAIGSDTGGSVRIPAAFNGVVGFKPTQCRVPRTGAYPLSFTLDCVGPLARSVQACADADAVFSQLPPAPLPARSLRGLRVAVPRGLLATHTEAAVQSAVDAALQQLQDAGAVVQKVDWDDLLAQPFALQEKGTLIAAEAAHIHRTHIDQHAQALDPFVLNRIRRGSTLDAASYVGIVQARQQLQAQLDARMADWDLLALPSVAITAPLTATLVHDEAAFTQTNALVLRNTSVFNFFDLPALSLPLPRAPGALPVGLMLVGARLQDRNLLATGAAVEALLARRPPAQAAL